MALLEKMGRKRHRRRLQGLACVGSMRGLVRSIGMETSVTKCPLHLKMQARWTGEVRIYGSSSPANIFDRRTDYLAAPRIFRSDGEAMVVARAYAIQIIDAGTMFTWADV